ncbi:MAG TPA: histidine-type phosphatase, partial [Caulobacteraceae bacterium]
MIGRLALIVLASLALAGAAPVTAKTAPQPGLTLERVVIVQRHGVRPPIPTNQELAVYAEKPWPAWPVKPGELTPHGGQTVGLIGQTLRRAYRDLLPAAGCRGADQVSVWADGADQRTRRTGEILAQALSPNCALKAAWAPPLPRDPIFAGDKSAPACRSDPDAARAALLAAIGPGGVETLASRSALKRLQAILAPSACAGGPGTCFLTNDQAVAGSKGSKVGGSLAITASLSEDLLLEYAEGMPRSDVGWGRAGSAADIAAVMPLHERGFELYQKDLYSVSRDGAPMARLVLAALAGEPRAAAPSFGPGTRLLALAGAAPVTAKTAPRPGL